jgi:hypothetical protein
MCCKVCCIVSLFVFQFSAPATGRTDPVEEG